MLWLNCVHTLKHVIDCEGAAVLELGYPLYQKCYIEAWHVRAVKEESMNKDEDFLTQMYNSLIKHTYP